MSVAMTDVSDNVVVSDFDNEELTIRLSVMVAISCLFKPDKSDCVSANEKLSAKSLKYILTITTSSVRLTLSSTDLLMFLTS
jgi:hypothetical protein